MFSRNLVYHGFCLAIGIALSEPRAVECPVSEGIRISKVEFEGLLQTHPRVVQIALENQKGNRFSCAAWEQERNRLKDLDIFADVALTAQAAGDSVSLVYRFRELPPLIPLASVSKTDQDGFSIGPSVAALNLLGTGKRLDVMARFGGSTEYQASISGRQLFGHSMEFSAAWIYAEGYNPFDTARENSYRLKAEGYWPWIGSRRIGMIGLGEYFRIHSDTSGVTLRKGNNDAVPRLGLGLRWDSRDRVLLPRRGVFAETRMTQNGGALGGPADYWEWLMDARAYLPVARRHGFMGNVLYQFRHAAGDTAIGRYDLFHAGGVNTLRGYPENSFSGQNECLVTAEYRFDVLEERVQRLGPWNLNYGIQWVLGSDAASLWDGNSARPGTFAPTFYSGVDVLVPGIERIRLEIGTRTAKLDLHLNFGLFEKTTIQRFRTR